MAGTDDAPQVLRLRRRVRRARFAEEPAAMTLGDGARRGELGFGGGGDVDGAHSDFRDPSHPGVAKRCRDGA